VADAANKQFVVDQLEERFTRNVNLNNNQITNVADPVDEQDTATKLYVDSLQPV